MTWICAAAFCFGGSGASLDGVYVGKLSDGPDSARIAVVVGGSEVVAYICGDDDGFLAFFGRWFRATCESDGAFVAESDGAKLSGRIANGAVVGTAGGGYRKPLNFTAKRTENGLAGLYRVATVGADEVAVYGWIVDDDGAAVGSKTLKRRQNPNAGKNKSKTGSAQKSNPKSDGKRGAQKPAESTARTVRKPAPTPKRPAPVKQAGGEGSVVNLGKSKLGDGATIKGQAGAKLGGRLGARLGDKTANKTTGGSGTSRNKAANENANTVGGTSKKGNADKQKTGATGGDAPKNGQAPVAGKKPPKNANPEGESPNPKKGKPPGKVGQKPQKENIDADEAEAAPAPKVGQKLKQKQQGNGQKQKQQPQEQAQPQQNLGNNNNNDAAADDNENVAAAQPEVNVNVDLAADEADADEQEQAPPQAQPVQPQILRLKGARKGPNKKAQDQPADAPLPGDVVEGELVSVDAEKRIVNLADGDDVVEVPIGNRQVIATDEEGNRAEEDAESAGAGEPVGDAVAQMIKKMGERENPRIRLRMGASTVTAKPVN